MPNLVIFVSRNIERRVESGVYGHFDAQHNVENHVEVVMGWVNQRSRQALVSNVVLLDALFIELDGVLGQNTLSKLLLGDTSPVTEALSTGVFRSLVIHFFKSLSILCDKLRHLFGHVLGDSLVHELCLLAGDVASVASLELFGARLRDQLEALQEVLE